MSYRFLKFPHYSCFEVKESISDIFTELPCSGDFENLGQLLVEEVLRGTDDFVLMDFHNFFSIYVFEVKESIYDISTGLPCSVDLENRDQLPVLEVLMILSYKFLKFLQYSCSQGQGIH